MRVAIIGYGAVAAIHARRLRSHAEVISVYGPDLEKCERFAQEHKILRAETELTAALAGADAAIVASPSARHYEQAMAALERGIHSLVELPACFSSGEANRLDELAHSKGAIIQCAHTSRYLEPYLLIGNWIRTGDFGEIQQIRYVRSIPPRERSWADDALWHHAAHPLDLFLAWFHSIQPLGCSMHPEDTVQNVAFLASIDDKTPVTISISYTARLPEVKMTIVGSNHTVETDGFSYIASDSTEFVWKSEMVDVYERAIETQDVAFLKACTGIESGIGWRETVKLIQCIERFAKI